MKNLRSLGCSCRDAQPPFQAALGAAGALQAAGWNPPSWQGFVNGALSPPIGQTADTATYEGLAAHSHPCHPRQLHNPIACQPRPSNCSWPTLVSCLTARVVNDRGNITHCSQGKGTQLPWGDCIRPMPIGSARHRNRGSLEPRRRFLHPFSCQNQISGSPLASTRFCGCLDSGVVRIHFGSCSPGLCSQPSAFACFGWVQCWRGHALAEWCFDLPSRSLGHTQSHARPPINPRSTPGGGPI